MLHSLTEIESFCIQNHKIQWILNEKNPKLQKKMAPKAPTLYFNIHNFTGPRLSPLKRTVLFQLNINQNNIFVIQSWGIAKKIWIPPLKIAIFFNFFIFSTHFRKNQAKSLKKTRVVLQNILDLNKKTLEPLFKTATILQT